MKAYLLCFNSLLRKLLCGLLMMLAPQTWAQVPLTDGEFNAILAQGESYFQQARFQNAIGVWEPLLEQAAGNLEIQFDALLRLSLAYKQLGMYPEVFPALNAAMDIADEQENPARQALVFSQISDAWLVDGDYESALKVADQAVELARGQNDPQLLARSLQALGNVLAVLDYHPQAREHYAEALQLAHQAADKPLIASIAVNVFKSN